MEHTDFWDNEDERCECEDCEALRKEAKEREANQIWAANQAANARMWNLVGGWEDEEE